jgi:hypothetical protein
MWNYGGVRGGYYGARGETRGSREGVGARISVFFRSKRRTPEPGGTRQAASGRVRRFVLRIVALLLVYAAVFTALVQMQFSTRH